MTAYVRTVEDSITRRGNRTPQPLGQLYSRTAADAVARADAGVWPPVLRAGPTVDQITVSGFRVTWTVMPACQGQVEYGLTSAYGSATTPELSFNYTTHIQELSGLSANTLYHYRIKATNPTGQITYSTDQTATTTAAAVNRPPDETALTFITPASVTSLPAFNVWQADSMFALNRVKRITQSPYGDYRINNAAVGGFNSDGSTIALIYGPTGNPSLFINTADMTVFGNDTRYGYWWDHSDPNLMYFSPASATSGHLLVKNINTVTSTTLKTFTGYTGDTGGAMGTYSGQSRDDRYFPVAAVRNSDSKYVCFGWDRTLDTKTPDIVVPASSHGGGDKIYMSLTGKYMIVFYDTTAGGNLQDGVVYAGPANTLVSPGTVMPIGSSWAPQTGYSGASGKITPYGSHWAFGIDTSGDECYITVGEIGGTIRLGPTMVRLRDGWVTYLYPYANPGNNGNGFSYTGHLCADAYDYPGWALIYESSSDATTNADEGNNQLVAMRLTPAPTNGGQITTISKRWCFGQVGAYGGGAVPDNQNLFARPNRDMTKVAFNSAWRQGAAATGYVFLCEVAP